MMVRKNITKIKILSLPLDLSHNIDYIHRAECI